MSNQNKITVQKFLSFCKLLDLKPSELYKNEKSVQDATVSPTRFSLDKLHDFRQQWNPANEVEKSAQRLRSLEECAEVIQAWIHNGESRVFCTANMQILIETHRNQRFAEELLSNIDFITTQSIPVEWALNQIGIHLPERVSTSNLLRTVCAYSSSNHKSIFLLGHQPDVLEQGQSKLAKEFPDLQVAGSQHIPPSPDSTDDALIETINQSNASLVLVSLPHLAQEMWLSKHRHKIQAVLFGAGRYFQDYAEAFNPSPALVEQTRLVWLHQLLQTPKEFWAHYLSNVPSFIWLILRNQFKDIRHRYSTSKSKDIKQTRKVLERIYIPTV